MEPQSDCKEGSIKDQDPNTTADEECSPTYFFRPRKPPVPKRPKNYCELCHITFKKAKTLVAHMLLHDGREMPFKCEECDRAFFLAASLTTHMKLHNLERPFTCIPCKLGFLHKNEHKKHMQMIHGEVPKEIPKMYTCEFCSKIFETNLFRKKHVIKLHKDKVQIYTRSNGQREFKRVKPEQLNDGKIHKQIPKIFKCDFCIEVFDKHILYRTHVIKLHNDKVEVYKRCNGKKYFKIKREKLKNCEQEMA